MDGAEHDNKRAREVCAGLQKRPQNPPCSTRVFWISSTCAIWINAASFGSRAPRKTWITPSLRRCRRQDAETLRDEVIVLNNPNLAAPELMRRTVALVEGRWQGTKPTTPDQQSGWSPSSVAALYKCRWDIEVFFKQIKQTLQLADFLGHNASAVRWQVWTALLT